ncbi:hypothetical protein Tcan_14095, partial [Toxocara canis]
GTMNVEHRTLSRIFSTGTLGGKTSMRKTSVPSAVIASTPLIGAPVGEGIGAHLSLVNAYFAVTNNAYSPSMPHTYAHRNGMDTCAETYTYAEHIQMRTPERAHMGCYDLGIGRFARIS